MIRQAGEAAFLHDLGSKYHQEVLAPENQGLFVGLALSEREEKVRRFVEARINEDRLILTRSQREQLVQTVLDEAVGFGPLSPLLRDDGVTEIMVNGPQEVFVERKGVLESVPLVSFRDDDHVKHIIDRIIAPINRHLDEASPMVDARLPDGSRLNAVISPLAIKGPTLTIRKFRRRLFTGEDLIGMGSLDRRVDLFLQLAVRMRKNVLVSGGTGSGKTTFLNLIAGYIPPRERIITIEDSAELRLNHPHVVSLESRPANIEGRGEIAIRQLVRNALRMRPDRIVVGEVRGGEALDMLQAMNTGHEGSLTTIHANSPRDSFSRLEMMLMMTDTSLPIFAVRDYVRRAIDLVVQLARLEDGSRKVLAVSLVGKDGAADEPVATRDLFRFERRGFQEDGTVEGSLERVGEAPGWVRESGRFGVQFPWEEVFGHGGA